MAKTLVALMAAALALAAASLGATAQTRDCPEGKVYDPSKGKCVTPRGSY